MGQIFRRFFSLILLGAGLLALQSGSFDKAAAGEFRWPTDYSPGSSPPYLPENVLGPPDGEIVEYLSSGMGVTYHSFTEVSAFDPAELADLLGVSVETLAAADFVAFEVWGPPFDNSTWTFSASGVTHTIQAPDEALATGAMTTDAYLEYFGIPGPPGGLDMWNFILVDLDPGFAFDGDFEVLIEGGMGPYGDPDLDAIAIMSSEVVAAEKSTWSAVKALYR